MMLQILFIRFLSNLMEKRLWARAGTTISPRISEATSANDLVKAKGRNSFPSAASIAKTGRKLTIVVARAVIMAEPTSTEAVYITSNIFFPLAPLFSGRSR